MSHSTATLLESVRDRSQALGGRHEIHGMVRAYCPNSVCPAREVWIEVKVTCPPSLVQSR
jgi:hypothetical protein